MGGVRRGALRGSADGLGRALAGVPPAGAGREPLGRTAVGGGPARRRRDRRRPGAGLRDRWSCDHATVSGTSDRAGARSLLRRGLRLGRALDRRREAGLRAGRRRGPLIEPRWTRRARNAAASDVELELLLADALVRADARRRRCGCEHRTGRRRATGLRSLDTPALVTSGYLEQDQPVLAGFRRELEGPREAGRRTFSARGVESGAVGSFSIRFLGCKVSHRGRTRDPRAFACRWALGASGWRADRGRQHVLCHPRGGAEVTAGRLTGRADPQARLCHGVRCQPRRGWFCRAARERGRGRSAGPRTRPRSSPAMSGRSAASGAMPASTGCARSSRCRTAAASPAPSA